MNLNIFFKNNIKDIIIILLITVCICIFIHLLNCSECDNNPKKYLDNIDKEIEKFLKNLYFVKNNVESFQNPTIQDRQNARLIGALQENYIIENVDNIKKLLNVDIKINDLNQRVSRILDRINSKYESTIKKKIFINTNGDISLIDV